MSFICYDCKKSQLPRVPANKLVIETRKKTYETHLTDKNGFQRVNFSYGHEIVKEVLLCKYCFNIRKTKDDRRRN